MEEEGKDVIIQPRIKNKHIDDLVDHYWGSISYVAYLIKAAEVKAGLILSFYGILLNFIYQNSGQVLEDMHYSILAYILFGICFLCMVLSIYFCMCCFIPRIEGKYEKNIFFFGDVVKKFGSIKNFSKTFYRISLDEDELFDQLGQQIFINSKIASKKLGYVKRALRLLALGLLVLLILAVYYGILSFQ